MGNSGRQMNRIDRQMDEQNRWIDSMVLNLYFTAQTGDGYARLATQEDRQIDNQINEKIILFINLQTNR